ncbi:hypothetical protein D3C80_1793210 [compost metagenome]
MKRKLRTAVINFILFAAGLKTALSPFFSRFGAFNIDFSRQLGAFGQNRYLVFMHFHEPAMNSDSGRKTFRFHSERSNLKWCHQRNMSRQNAQLPVGSAYRQAIHLLGENKTLRCDNFKQKGIHFHSS